MLKFVLCRIWPVEQFESRWLKQGHKGVNFELWQKLVFSCFDFIVSYLCCYKAAYQCYQIIGFKDRFRIICFCICEMHVALL